MGELKRGLALKAEDPDSVTVGLASGLGVAKNLHRAGLFLINISDGRVSLGVGQAAQLGKGITLDPGATFNMNDFGYFDDAVYFIGDTGSQEVSIQEFSYWP